MTLASPEIPSEAQHLESNPEYPRTSRAFGSLTQAMRVRRSIETSFPELAGPALRLFDADRGRIFRFWARLTPAARETLLRQVADLDLDLLERNLELLKDPDVLKSRTAGELSPPDILDPVTDPGASAALQLGEEVLANGWLGLVEGAGGTGSRFFKASGELPKGLYRISPSGAYDFFEIRLARLSALRRRYGKPIPYVVMVSDATREHTLEYFDSRRYFGLEDEILIVPQRSLPYLEEVAPGEFDLVLENPGKVAVGGYGHADFTKYVLLRPDVQRFLARHGVRYVQWLQIDNPLAVIGHRYLLGAHRRAEPRLNPDALSMSFIALRKEVATEAAGLLVRRGGGLAVWEYSDMDPVSKHLLEDEAGRLWLAVERQGEVLLVAPETSREDDRLIGLGAVPSHLQDGLRYRWGAINPNLVAVTLQSVREHCRDNPPLVARKSCIHIDQDGEPGDPQKKFVKFEAFLFDGLNDGVVIAEERGECFAPTKNAEGEVDSPLSARRLMIEQAARRLREIGWEVSNAPGTIVELTALLELSSEDLAKRVGSRGRIEAGGVLSIHGLDLRIGDGLVVKGTGALHVAVLQEDPRAALDVDPSVVLPPGMVIDDVRQFGTPIAEP